MTIEEFRGEADAPLVNRPRIAVDEPVAIVEAQKMSSSSATEKQLLKNIQDANAPTEQLKLKRTKPLKRTESALEKSLNLKRAR